MPYAGRDPEAAGSAEEFAYLTRVKADTLAEDRRRAERKKAWAIEDAEREEAATAARIARQRERDTELRAELRGRFFAANPAASQADFMRLLPSMRDQELLERTRADEELEALRERSVGL